MLRFLQRRARACPHGCPGFYFCDGQVGLVSLWSPVICQWRIYIILRVSKKAGDKQQLYLTTKWQIKCRKRELLFTASKCEAKNTQEITFCRRNLSTCLIPSFQVFPCGKVMQFWFRLVPPNPAAEPVQHVAHNLEEIQLRGWNPFLLFGDFTTVAGHCLNKILCVFQ